MMVLMKYISYHVYVTVSQGKIPRVRHKQFVHINASTFHVMVLKEQFCKNGSNKTEIGRGTV